MSSEDAVHAAERLVLAVMCEMCLACEHPLADHEKGVCHDVITSETPPRKRACGCDLTDAPDPDDMGGSCLYCGHYEGEHYPEEGCQRWDSTADAWCDCGDFTPHPSLSDEPEAAEPQAVSTCNRCDHGENAHSRGDTERQGRVCWVYACDCQDFTTEPQITDSPEDQVWAAVEKAQERLLEAQARELR